MFKSKYSIGFSNSLIALLLSIFCFVSFSSAQTFSGTGLPVTVPDSTGGCGGAIGAATNGVSCVIVPVSGVTGTLQTLTASFTVGNDQSTWMGDYAMVLFAPGATPPSGLPSLVLMNNTGANPPNSGSCGDSTNIAAGTTLTFADTPTGTANNLPSVAAGLTSTQNIPTGTYNPSQGTTSPVGSINSTFGGLTSAQQNGNWQMCFYDLQGADTMSVSNVSLTLNQLAPTSGDGEVTGRVVNQTGRGLSNAVVKITDSITSEVYTARTNQFGYFHITDLAIGNTHILEVQRKGFFFNPMIFTLRDSISDLEIVGF